MGTNVKVLWLSRHEPDDRQVYELRRLFGDEVEVVQSNPKVRSGREVVKLMKESGCHEVIAVLPVYLLQQICEAGVKPIKSTMDRRLNKFGKAEFIFKYFERIEEVRIITTVL